MGYGDLVKLIAHSAISAIAILVAVFTLLVLIHGWFKTRKTYTTPAKGLVCLLPDFGRSMICGVV